MFQYDSSKCDVNAWLKAGRVAGMNSEFVIDPISKKRNKVMVVACETALILANYMYV